MKGDIMKYINTAYEDCKKYVKDNGGFLMDGLIKTDVYKNYLINQNKIKEFNNLKVKIKYFWSGDWTSDSDEKIGRIKIEEDKIRFFEGRKRSHYYNLDSGLFEGWFATLIPLEIETI
jgi:hypothetical protein